MTSLHKKRINMQGVRLDSIRERVEIKLPKSGATIWIWNDILAGEIMGGLQTDSLGRVKQADSFHVIKSLIADWNFIDKEGEKMEISVDNIKRMSIADFNVLAQEVTKISEQGTLSSEEKKS